MSESNRTTELDATNKWSFGSTEKCLCLGLWIHGEEMGVEGNDRTENCNSELFRIKQSDTIVSGVPQGFILGPLLIVFYLEIFIHLSTWGSVIYCTYINEFIHLSLSWVFNIGLWFSGFNGLMTQKESQTWTHNHRLISKWYHNKWSKIY